MVSLYGKCAKDDTASCRTLVSERVPRLQKALREVAVKLLGEAKPCYLGWGVQGDGSSGEDRAAREETDRTDRRTNKNKEEGGGEGEGEEVRVAEKKEKEEAKEDWFEQQAMHHRGQARPDTHTGRSMALSEMSTDTLIDRWHKCPADASVRQRQVTR